jgi:hypothetical protein
MENSIEKATILFSLFQSPFFSLDQDAQNEINHVSVTYDTQFS